MKKTIYLSTLTIAALLTLSACTDSTGGDTPKGTSSPTACAQEYFNSDVSTVLNACIACHSVDGPAKSTRLIFKAPLNENKTANFQALKSFVDATGDRVVKVGSNEIAHTGGAQLTGGTKTVMQTFVDYAQGTKQCLAEVDAGSVNTKSITLVDPKNTLRSASFKLQGKAPSDAELAKLSDINKIDAILDTYMQSEVFYQWLHQSFNDFLLTDFYKPGRNAEDLLNSDDFPQKRWYDKLKENDVISGDMRRKVYESVNYAISREATELMIHVIKNNRPFSEILTADYMLVNPYSARTYGLDIPNFTIPDDALKGDAKEFKEKVESKYRVDDFREAKLEGIPHAGVLTTITYLNRFPSTNTNLDRARSAKTQLFFLDTDILALANRPIDAVDVIGNSATWTNPNCTVCHNVMEPISSTFSNWDNRGRYRPGWRLDLAAYSREPGLSIDNKAPVSYSNNLLQWLTSEMVKDDRFAMASVKMFVKALLGRDALKKPETEDANYADAIKAYKYENDILEGIKKKFVANNMNAKTIIKEIIKSPLYRASGYSSSNSILSKNLGLAHLITPEGLDRKIYDTMGYYWTNRRSSNYQGDNNNTHYHRLLNDREYSTLYGGINSGSISKRESELNGVMANVQMRMAIQMGCFPTTRDFFFPREERKLFPYVSKTLEPIGDGAISDIKKNIIYLHKHILGEDVQEGDAEFEATYKLFYDTYVEGKERVNAEEEDASLLYECRLYHNPKTFERLSEENRRFDEISNDQTYIIRAWSAVIVYLLSDFNFVYENSAK